ncbi:sodium/potassium-transporting ATPase subunit beta-1-like [Danaus plexippus]|uniref:sodium/potassium-transporting ATPase subunit beta-1-like n=1 Tax=Danaus plexippus TaxID=13037 RepID=UPI000239E609|nr:sodium/potassium-transporting ATPase subunit beta-1-like [Danaus plexippus]
MASKTNGVESEWARAPPAPRPLGERILRILYNPDEKTFLGRTLRRWGVLFAFYLVFYAALVAFFAIYMAAIFSTLDNDKPKYTLESSLIGANPGVSYRPRPRDEITVQYNAQNSIEYDHYISELADLFKQYKNESWVTSKTECTSEDNFGYPHSPCFFIKLNKIYGWKPQYYERDFPEDMPADLVQYITMLPEAERQQLWVSCRLENDTGAELQYPWGRGLAGRFYPYLNQQGYTSPLIAVKVTPPVNTLNIMRCRVWAKNVIYNMSIKRPRGYTRILLRVDDPSYNGTAPAEQMSEDKSADNDTTTAATTEVK